MDRLEPLGIRPRKQVFWNTVSPILVEHTLARGEGILAHKGSLVVDTTPYTGRSPRDKFVVREPGVEEEVWWGEVNQPF
ncbi:MAG: phosphoenolpyruvate carboxykinase (ATP), partial [Thermus sp.]